jgi:hypothetical protein
MLTIINVAARMKKMHKSEKVGWLKTADNKNVPCSSKNQSIDDGQIDWSLPSATWDRTSTCL